MLQIPPCPPGVQPGAPATLTEQDLATVRDLMKRLRHQYAVAVGWNTLGYNLSQNTRPERILSANPQRISLSIQLPAGVIAYYGGNQGITNGQGSQSGYQLPPGGGLVNGPEMTLAIWLILASTVTPPVTLTVSELLGDVAYP